MIAVNYYSWHIGDHASHTRHLTPLEDLALRRMLDNYYLHERALVGDSVAVARSIGMRDHLAEVKAVLDEFFHEMEDGWHNKRADAEIEQFSDKREKAAKAGRASGLARAKANARSSPVQRMLSGRSTDDEPSQEPTPRANPNPNGTSPPSCGRDDGFEEFWDLYDKKTGKKTAQARWRRLSQADREAIMAFVPSYVAAKPDKAFRKDPERFISQRTWEDELIVDRRSQGLSGARAADASGTAEGIPEEDLEDYYEGRGKYRYVQP